MGVTVVGTTVASKTVEHDDDVDLLRALRQGGGVPAIALNSLGTGAAVTSLRGGASWFRCNVTTGSTAPAVAANNLVITCSAPVRKVFLSYPPGDAAPGWHVSSVSGATVSIGTKAAAATSTVYRFELIVLF